jgi:beta-phosphoglucomutase-like phosphatase (HAD superfamily)
MAEQLPPVPDLSSVRALICDWDDTYGFSRGTPSNPGPKIAHHKAVAATFGFKLTDALIEQHWGKGLRAELPIFYGNPADKSFEDLLEAFESLDSSYPKMLLPGARALHELAGQIGLIRGIVTSHLTANATRELERAGLPPEEFDFIYGSDITPAIKPDPAAFDPALAYLRERDIAPNQAFYVGDALSDGAAKLAGLEFVGVATCRVSIGDFNRAGFYAGPNLEHVGSLLLSSMTELAID